MSQLGPLEPIVVAGGQLVAAGLALIALVSGKNPWSPVVPGLKNYAVRVYGAAAGVGLVYLFLASKERPPTFPFATFSMFAGGIGVVGAIFYLAARMLLCFQCTGDKAWYVRGLRLQRNALAVLEGRIDGLPEQYAKAGRPPPTNEQEYFCKSGKDPEFDWTRTSWVASYLILVVSYGILILPLTLAIAGSSIALGLKP